MTVMENALTATKNFWSKFQESNYFITERGEKVGWTILQFLNTKLSSRLFFHPLYIAFNFFHEGNLVVISTGDYFPLLSCSLLLLFYPRSSSVIVQILEPGRR